MILVPFSEPNHQMVLSNAQRVFNLTSVSEGSSLWWCILLARAGAYAYIEQSEGTAFVAIYLQYIFGILNFGPACFGCSDRRDVRRRLSIGRDVRSGVACLMVGTRSCTGARPIGHTSTPDHCRKRDWQFASVDSQRICADIRRNVASTKNEVRPCY